MNQTDPVDLIIRHGRLLTPVGVLDTGMCLDDGRIVGFGTDSYLPPARRQIDATGLLVLPGAIDPHVHFRDPGFPERETFASGSAAAALGGVTTVFDMPNTRPATMTAADLNAKATRAGATSHVDVGLLGGADESNIDALDELLDAGAVALKVFMYSRRDPPPAGVTDDALLLRIMRTAARHDVPVAVHAENADLIAAGRVAVRRAERIDWASHLDSRPDLAEVEAVSRAILLAGEAGARLHVCHVSAAGSVDVVHRAKQDGQPVTAEATPQHLLLDSAEVELLGPDLIMVPPVRTERHQRHLWEALREGIIDMVATDHAPHTEAAKNQPPGEAATGLVGVQWSVPLLLSAAAGGHISWTRVVEALSGRAATTFGLDTKGGLTLGADADVILVDPSVDTHLQTADLASIGRATPFAGRHVTVAVRYVILGGQMIVENGRLDDQPTGRFIRPGNPRTVSCPA